MKKYFRYCINAFMIAYWGAFAHALCYLDYKHDRIDMVMCYKGEVINLMCLFYIIRTLKKSKLESPVVWIGVILLCWFMYYTPIDIANVDQSIKLRVMYGAIDIITYIYLIATLISHFMSIISKHIVQNALTQFKDIVKSIFSSGRKKYG